MRNLTSRFTSRKQDRRRWRWLVLAAAAVLAISWRTQTAISRKSKPQAAGSGYPPAPVDAAKPSQPKAAPTPPSAPEAAEPAPIGIAAAPATEAESELVDGADGPAGEDDTEPFATITAQADTADSTPVDSEVSADSAESTPAEFDATADSADSTPAESDATANTAADPEATGERPAAPSRPSQVVTDAYGTVVTGSVKSSDNGKGNLVKGNEDGSCPDDHPIKGNGNSRIYHLPGESSYVATIPEFCFASEEEAAVAGFRPRAR